jgi:hypothetical protein
MKLVHMVPEESAKLDLFRRRHLENPCLISTAIDRDQARVKWHHAGGVMLLSIQD